LKEGLAVASLSATELLLHEKPREALGVVFELAETCVAQVFIERSCLKLKRIKPHGRATTA